MTLSYHALDQRLADFSHLLEALDNQKHLTNPSDLLSIYKDNNEGSENIITFGYYGKLIHQSLSIMKKNNKSSQSLEQINTCIFDAISNLSHHFDDLSDENEPNVIEMDENSSSYISKKIIIKTLLLDSNDNSSKKRKLTALTHAVSNLEIAIKKSASTQVSYSECPEASNVKNRNIDWLTCTLIPILFKQSPSRNQQEARIAAFGAAHLLGRDPDAHENVWGILDFFMDLQHSNRTDYWKNLIGDEKIWFDTDFVNNVKVERLFIDGTWRSDGLVDPQLN